MALTVFQKRLSLWAALLVVLFGCAPRTSEPEAPKTEVEFKDSARRPNFDAVLVLTPASSHSHQVWRSLTDELSLDFDVVTRTLSADAADVARAIAEVRPSCIVLLGNGAMKQYLQYQRGSAGPFPPAVVVMASYLEDQRPLFKNTTGIAYEVPGVTAFVNLRSFINNPVQRVGVVHRSASTKYVARQDALARQEQVKIVAQLVSDRPTPKEVQGALRELIDTEKVDALWVLNDNGLLTPELISQGWLPTLHEHPIAVVVGVKSLIDAHVHFGSFGLLPDHAGLGIQTADLVFRLSESDWDASAIPVELPLSVESVVDLDWTRKNLSFREEALQRIDRAVE